MSRAVSITSFGTWTASGASVNAPPLPYGTGALNPWLDAAPLQSIHPGTRRPHSSAVALVQLAHRVLLSRGSVAAGSSSDREGMGLILGTSSGSAAADFDFQTGLRERGTAFGSPSLFVYTLPSSAPAEATVALGIKGPLLTLSNGSASGLTALATAAAHVQSGKLDACLCGGMELGIAIDHRPTGAAGDWLALFIVEPTLPDSRASLESWSSGMNPATLKAPSPEPALLTVARFAASAQKCDRLDLMATSREGSWTRVVLSI